MSNAKAIRITCKGMGSIAIEDLTGMQGNLKKISRKNLEMLKNRILKKGFNVPYHIWKHHGKNYLLDGHQRTRALLELQAQGYFVPELPFDIIEAATMEEAKDSLLGISSQYGEFTAGMELDTDLRLPSGEIRLENINPASPAGDDDVPEAAPRIAKLGDLWTLGPHRICVGSATSKDDVATLMGNQLAQLVFTDPPYGVDYDSRGEKDYLGGIANDEKKDLELERQLLAPAFRQAFKYTVSDAAFYIWHASVSRKTFERAMTAAGLQERQYLIWAKPWIVMGRGQYHYQHEPCFYAGKGSTVPRWTGDRTESTVWTATLHTKGEAFVVLADGILLSSAGGSQVYIHRDPPKTKKHRNIRCGPEETVIISTLDGSDVWEVKPDSKTEYVHPNQKPTELALRAIRNHTNPWEIVLDLFAGSGSTLVAAHRSDRQARLMEIDPRFVDIIIKRWCIWVHARHLEPEVTRNGKPYDWTKFCPEIA